MDIFNQPFWAESLPRQRRSWFILPSGRTPWVCCPMSSLSCYRITRNPQGLDWHGPSADDAWGTVSALSTILETSSKWKAWAITPGKVIIIGHSNGGQGTWYNAARHPDRVVASKEQLPSSLAWSKFVYFSDPCCWIHQSTGLRPLDPLTVSVPTNLTSMRANGPLPQLGSLHRPISAGDSRELFHRRR